MKAALLGLVLCAAALSACTEKPQTAGAGRQPAAAFQGTGVASFTAPGWTPGDRNSWEQGLKTRAQQGQNDYVKAN